MITLEFVAGKESERTYFLKETFDVESVDNAIWYFSRVAKMIPMHKGETLYGRSIGMRMTAITETSEFELFFGQNEDLSFEEAMWEFASALTFTDKQCDEIISTSFGEDE